MKTTAPQLKKYYAVTLLAILLLLAAIVPYPAEEVPEWKVLYIDEHYLPGANRKIVQSVNNDYFNHKSEVEAVTDKNGFVTFSPVYVWGGALERIAIAPAGWLGWDTGTRVSVSASDTCTTSISWTVGEGEKPDKLVCPQ